MVSFKNVTETSGLRGIGAAEETEIKQKKKQVGRICGPSWRSTDSKFRVKFMVENDDVDSSNWNSWRWITLTVRFDSMKEAREFVKRRFNDIEVEYNLHTND